MPATHDDCRRRPPIGARARARIWSRIRRSRGAGRSACTRRASTGVGDVGEMHIRPRRYVGIAPLADGVCNVCVVTGPRPDGRDADRRRPRRDRRAIRRLARAIRARAVRRARCACSDRSRSTRAPPASPGLLLAGDAAGFVDPMTGDGLHLAMRGAVLAARRGAARARARRLRRRRRATGARARTHAFGAQAALQSLRSRRLVDSPAARSTSPALGARDRARVSMRCARSATPGTPRERIVAFVVAVIIGLHARRDARLAATRARAPARARRGRAAGRRLSRRWRCCIPRRFVAMGTRGRVARRRDATAQPVSPDRARRGWPSGVLLFVGEQGARSTGRSARSASAGRSACSCCPVVPLVTTGPYRYVAHPNYVAVVGELVGTAMMVERASRGRS